MRTSRSARVLALVIIVAAGLFGTACGTPSTSPAPATPGVQKAAAPSALPAGPPIRILVTHPSVTVLERFVSLKELGLLPAGNLEVVGLVHASEREDYSDAEDFAREQGAWMRIERLTCSLSPDSLFRPNECTPVFEKLLSTSDGMVFTGGPDLPPTLYGEKTLLTTAIRAPHRHYTELSLMFHLLGRGEKVGPIPLLGSHPDYPVLAICLGMQTMNVATGGTMIQDIPSELYDVHTFEDGLEQPAENVHRSFHYLLDPGKGIAFASVHPIRVVAGSRLGAFLSGAGEVVHVLSAHHQAVERLGVGLHAVATSVDGKVIEAVEHDVFDKVIGVQFHPDYRELWRPELEYRLAAGGSVRNVAAAAMEQHPASREFNRKIWLRFSRLAQAAAGVASQP